MTHTLTMQRNVRSTRRGFSFTEVLFAVMVLGIGFIMIAAMFPVTIRQTQNTMGDTQGATLGQEAMAYLQTIGTDLNFPPTVPRSGNTYDTSKPAQIYSLQQAPNGTLPAGVLPLPGYMAARGNFINPNNPRLAWLPVYRRGVHTTGGVTVPDAFAQVFVFAIQSRNRPQYYAWPDATRNYSDFDAPSGAGANDVATLRPKQLQVKVQYNSTTQHGELTIVDATNPGPRQWAAPGAYVIIADDPNVNLPLNRAGQSTGRIYQLGESLTDDNSVWSLMPGSDMVRNGGANPIAGDDNEITTAATAYMIGRGYTNPFNAADGYSGPAQDLGIYTGYIQISPDIHP
jgi:hypothetical protein